MSSEQAWKAARHLSEAADVARRAADSLGESTQALRQMFEDGYGGNALHLIELLQNPLVVVNAPAPDDNASAILKHATNKLIRKLATLQPTTPGDNYDADEVVKFVRRAKLLVEAMDT